MPDPRYNTPSFDNVRHVAEQALNNDDGIVLTFAVAQYGTYANCELAARSFQTSFTSLRARMAKQNARHRGEHVDERISDALGVYSTLVCQRSRFPDRVEVFIGQSRVLLKTLDIRNAATGEPIHLGRGETRWERLNKLAASTPQKLTLEEYDYLEDHYPNKPHSYWKPHEGDTEPWWPRPTEAKQAPTQIIDAVDDFFAQEGDETP